MRAGDRLLLKGWLDTVFTDTVRIDDGGSVILPRLGLLHIAGMAPAAIADSVRHTYSRVISVPSIEVTPLRRVTVLGEVRKPATYFMETRSTIREAVALAGGITDIGTLDHVTMIRDSTRTVYKHWEERADAEVIIRSGDVVWVDREPWLKQNLFSVISGIGVLLSLLYTVTR